MKEKLLDSLLPMNRKERYFTGTVIPMIICDRNLQHLGIFTKLCGCQIDPVDPREVQFFTEYNLKEAIFGSSRKRFSGSPKAGDTPDVLIMVGRELIAVEAKVYDSVTTRRLQKQMDVQREVVLDYLKRELGLDRIHHIAVLPAKLAAEIGARGFPYPIVTLEAIHSAYVGVLGPTYFTEVLRIALQRFDDLRGKGKSFGANADGKITGQEIVDRYTEGSLEFVTMGRKKGLEGDLLNQDIDSGRWRTQEYEVRCDAEPVNPNWFRIEDFTRRIIGIS